MSNEIFVLGAAHGQVSVVKNLIENGVDINCQDMYGATALMWAAENGELTTATLLIEKGAKINHQAKKGWAALMCSRIPVKKTKKSRRRSACIDLRARNTK